MSVKIIEQDISTEAKIKAAASRLFTEKGFDAVRTRDIAEEAGINLALLNYYFRSKEKLFELIMRENFHQFIEQLIPIMSSEELPLEHILTQVCANYIDLLKTNPDLPFFIITEIRKGNRKPAALKDKMTKVRAAFIKRIEQTVVGRKMTPSEKSHMMMNFMSLILFPFIAQPVLMEVNKLTQKDFDKLMDERKKLIPLWISTFLKLK
jgi:AcrR family transcriptional regulator